MNDLAHPTPPAGSRMKANKLRLVASVLVGLLVMLVTGLFGVELVTAAIVSVASAVLFWLGWLLFFRAWVRLAHRRS